MKKARLPAQMRRRKGHFEAANSGTLFLDEIGELPKDMQVKLLRVLQEGEVVRLGASEPISVNVRIVVATNRNLVEEVREGRFREDLFYRIAVAYLKVPPLRDREGDVGRLIDHLVEQINQENEKQSGQPGYKRKEISAGARNLLLNHSWPGNIRELQNTLRRAMVWADGEMLDKQDIEEALLPPYDKGGDILNRPLGGGFSLEELLGEVARHYLQRANQAAATKKKAAELVGATSPQTFTNWLAKYKVEWT